MHSDPANRQSQSENIRELNSEYLVIASHAQTDDTHKAHQFSIDLFQMLNQVFLHQYRIQSETAKTEYI